MLNIYKESIAKKYIKSLILKQFVWYINDIYIVGFRSKISYKVNKLVFFTALCL